jgi:hypothetical protein
MYYLLPVVAIGGYYAYFYLLGGKDRFQKNFRKQLGLRDGEVIHAVYNGYHAIERSMGDHAMAVVGVSTRGAYFMLALTNQNRLVIGHNEGGSPPMGFEVGQVQVYGSNRKGDHKTLAGPTGKMENTQVVQVVGGSFDMHLQLPGSGAAAITTWSQGGGVPALQMPG